MNKKFYDREHAHSYLSRSVVRDEAGEPVMVEAVETISSKNTGTYLRYLKDGSSANVGIDQLDLEPVPLGFLNEAETYGVNCAHYMARAPYRMWKVGLTDRNLNIYLLRDDQASPSLRHVLLSKDLRATIKNLYPEYSDCLNKLSRMTDTPVSIAFHRDWAMDRHMQLYYKYHRSLVGSISDNGRPTLLPPFRYLQEALNEVIPA